MFRLMFALSLGIGGLIWLANAAYAQSSKCAERARIVAQLQSRFGERRLGMGLQGGSAIIEIYVSPKTGSWSILVTRPTGISCLAAAGQGWDDTAPAEPQKPGA